MLNRIIAFSVKQKLTIGLFVVALIAYGSYQVTKLPIDAVPDITNNQVQIITTAPALGATDIERLITFPVEQANSNIPGLLELRSFSRFGLSLVTLVFDDKVDIYWARQQVTERLSQVKDQIPPGVPLPILAPITTGLGEIYQYIIRPKPGFEHKYSITDLRTVQDWVVRRELLRVNGVADISSFGGKLKQYEIAINPDKLYANGVSIKDVFTALEGNNQNTGGAYIEKNQGVLFIRSEGLIGNEADIAAIPVKMTSSGAPLYIRDLAEIKIGFATRYGAMTYNGKGEVAGAVVMMVKGANSNKVIADVKEQIDRVQKMLPEGLVIEAFLDRTKMVNNAIGTVETNLLEGALIVIFVLVFFLGNWRAGLLVASVIPLAMLFAIILMNQFGVSGNLMSLGALDFGLIIDGAVIIVEATMHQLAHNNRFRKVSLLNQTEMDAVVNESAGKMMNSAVFGQIVILVVYLPIFTLSGIEGKMFMPMAQTVAFALLGAFILSLTYVPMMSAWVLSKKISHTKTWSDKTMEKLEQFYQYWLAKAIRVPKLILVTVSVLFVLAVAVLLNMGGEFIPALEEGDFAVETRVITGSNLNLSVDVCLKAEKILLAKFPEVKMVVGKTGSSEIPTDPMPVEASDLMIILKDKKEWTSAASFNELAAKMKTALSVIPGVSFGFQYPVQMRFNELMTGARQDVVCKIYGENLDSLAHYAHKLGKVINTVSGSSDLFIESVNGMPQLVINYNRLALAQYGVSINTVNEVVNASFSGQQAGVVYEGEKRFDLVVRMLKTSETDVSTVENLLIPLPTGAQIPLHMLAEINVIDGPNQIQREDTKRRIVIGFNSRGTDVQTIVQELQRKVASQIKLPTGYTITYGGSFKNLEEAKTRLAVAVPVALLLIFLLLYFAFRSVKQGLLIYTAIPLSAIGGVFALAVRGMPFSISAGVGFIALFGVAVLNGIVLIAEFNRISTQPGFTDLRRVVFAGTKNRMRPVLMTAFVASLGFLPMALSNGAGAEVQRPLASVVIGGLLLATFLTLFVLPILYLLFNKAYPKVMKINKALPITFLFLSLGLLSIGQQVISLQAAIDSALTNNTPLQNEKLQVLYHKQLIKTAGELPHTNVLGEYGQVNSYYQDNRIGISQSFEFPLVYHLRKKALQEEWNVANAQLTLKAADLKKQVSSTFNTLVYLKEQRKLLATADSLYAQFLIRATKRLNAGESNALEQVSVENQRWAINNRLALISAEYDQTLARFQLLINSSVPLVPQNTENKLLFDIPLDGVAANFPGILVIEAETQLAKKQIGLERSRLLPTFSLGASSQTIFGVGANEQFYNFNQRFQSVQIGMGIPLFPKAQHARVKAAKIASQIAQNNLYFQQQQFMQQLVAVKSQVRAQQGILTQMQKITVPNAQLIFDIAQQQFVNGEINYLDWVTLINQGTATQAHYLEALYQQNENLIQLNYLLNQ